MIYSLYINIFQNKLHHEEFVYLPYIQGTTDCISRLLKKYDIHTIQKPLNKMASRFKSTKDKQLLTQKSGVYKIPCFCDKVYNGQTSHHITRISEQIRDTRLENQQPAVPKHSTVTKHSTDFDKTEVTANIHSYCPRIIREAIEITKHPITLNVKTVTDYAKPGFTCFPQANHPTTSTPKR
jgi:hypothetical protein